MLYCIKTVRISTAASDSGDYKKEMEEVVVTRMIRLNKTYPLKQRIEMKCDVVRGALYEMRWLCIFQSKLHGHKCKRGCLVYNCIATG